MQADSSSTVVFIESAAAMGGVQFSTLYLVQALDQSRWRPIVVCPSEGDLTRACKAAGVETLILGHSRWWSTSVRVGQRRRLPNPFAWIWNALVILRAARQVASLLRELSPDIVVTKGLPSHFIGGLAAMMSGIPCVWHVQDFISERNLGIYRSIFGATARWLPQHIIVDGASIKKQLPRSVQSLTTIIHNGIDTNLFRPGRDGSTVRGELKIPKDHLVIGHVGRITPWKGQHYLIEAFAQIASKHPNVSLVFAGSPIFDHDGYERRLRTMAVSLGGRIKFVNRQDLPNVLAAMDIFAFTSIEKDTSPLALLSAMSTGLPIVAFDIEGVRELIDDNEQLLRVPVGQTEHLSNSLQSLIADAQRRSALGRGARKLAEQKFSLQHHLSQIEGVLQKVKAVPTDSTVEDLTRVATEPRAVARGSYQSS